MLDFYKNLSGSDWASLIPFGVACAAIGFGTKLILDNNLEFLKGKPSKVNLSVKKTEGKVVDTVDMEDIGKQAVFCRCWRSKKFPYCDGSHNAHNEKCGDNVGPLIIKKKES
ncbi:CDGSH iron-sulfur domain-containing protein 2 [Halocaridina rubra]|uniref:CDGSH iron-sulfur domain-containing protein 2 n=1 Tax=Halocaridina rubra TaxID=373956 RepID=A0AAN9ABR6_HALRR